MTGLPWLKFSPAAWRGDQALRACSVAARGLWIECLCIMHEAKPYGHLLLNGEPVEDDTLARMTGVSVDEVSALMGELRKAGVFDVTGKGVIFSRRMVRDHAKAQKGKKAASKRWSQDAEKTAEKDRPNGSPKANPVPKSIEDRKKKEEPNGSSKKGTRLPDDWAPDIAFAMSLGMSASQAQNEADKFRDWWPAQPGQKGVKLDWGRTWKTWCRNAMERSTGTSPQNRRRTVADEFADIARDMDQTDDQNRLDQAATGNVLRIPSYSGR